MTDKPKRARYMTAELYRAKLSELNPTIKLVGLFTDMQTRTEHECEVCSTQWLGKPMNHTRTTGRIGCPQCKGHFIDLTGQKHHRFTVIECTEERNSRREVLWRCECDCGTEFKTTGRNIRSGDTKSCGCLNRERITKHGLHSTPEYRILQDMIRRCRPSDQGGDPNYGDRGITVCYRWQFGEGGKTGVECFVADMGLRPYPEASIDRENNNYGYRPNNCRWTDWTTQCRNTRRNLLVEWRGERVPLVVAVESSATSLTYDQVYPRIRAGWDFLDAITIPMGS